MDIVDHDRQRLIDFVLMIKNLLERDHPQVTEKVLFWIVSNSDQIHSSINVFWKFIKISFYRWTCDFPSACLPVIFVASQVLHFDS